jgi:sugar/nucleoside kinase (ribokinase family)
MSQHQHGPVVCVSYLAAAALWKVARFPMAGQGAEVLAVEQSIAADGPMTAAVLAALDVPTVLLSNSISEDSYGAEVERWLRRHQVATITKAVTGVPTPQTVVVADDQTTRTWFSYLPNVVDDLGALDLAPIRGASFAYIDCYRVIEASAVRAIHVARTAGLPLLLNLGGLPISPSVAAVLPGCPRLIVQSNVDDADHLDAPRLGASMLAETDAAWVVITAGASGAVALSRTQELTVPAFRVTVRHTHCAGAAFSGGLLYGLLHEWSMGDSLVLACASGALRCERAHHEPMPTLTELRSFMDSRERIGIPAA